MTSDPNLTDYITFVAWVTCWTLAMFMNDLEYPCTEVKLTLPRVGGMFIFCLFPTHNMYSVMSFRGMQLVFLFDNAHMSRIAMETYCAFVFSIQG